MQLPPISELLALPTPNYINPTDVHGPAVIILTCIFLPTTICFVLLRTFTRLFISKAFGLDDTLMLLALIPTTSVGALTLLGVFTCGWNRHVWDVPPESLPEGLKLEMACEVLFGVACSLTKLSLLVFTYRIMSNANSTLKRLSQITMIIVTVEMCIFVIVVISTCRPVALYWTLSFEPQQCINETAHLLAAGIINSFTDVAVVLIPIPVVMNLQLPRRQQVVLVGVFSAGFVVCIAGAVRIYYVYELNRSYDKTWWAYPTWISGNIELYTGIIAGSIPATKALATRFLPRVLGNSNLNSGLSLHSRPVQTTGTMRSNSQFQSNVTHHQDFDNDLTAILSNKTPAVTSSCYATNEETEVIKIKIDRSAEPEKWNTIRVEKNLTHSEEWADIKDKPLPPSPLAGPVFMKFPKVRDRERDLESGQKSSSSSKFESKESLIPDTSFESDRRR